MNTREQQGEKSIGKTHKHSVWACGIDKVTPNEVRQVHAKKKEKNIPGVVQYSRSATKDKQNKTNPQHDGG